MLIATHVEEITKEAAYYRQLALIFIIVAIAFAIMSIVLWFVLDINHSIKVTTGIGMEKELKKIKKNVQNGEIEAHHINKNNAVLTWNTSGLLKKGKKETGQDETTVLDTNEKEIDVEETTLLTENSDGFVIEEEIKFTGTNEKI